MRPVPLEVAIASFFPFFRIEVSTVALALVLALVLSAVAALVPAWRVTQLNVIDALRRVE